MPSGPPLSMTMSSLSCPLLHIGPLIKERSSAGWCDELVVIRMQVIFILVCVCMSVYAYYIYVYVYIDTQESIRGVPLLVSTWLCR